MPGNSVTASSGRSVHACQTALSGGLAYRALYGMPNLTLSLLAHHTITCLQTRVCMHAKRPSLIVAAATPHACLRRVLRCCSPMTLSSGTTCRI
jgi:hypothetical protein